MTNEQFEALVGRLEEQAQSAPGWYWLKVVMLAALGNLYIAAMVVLIVLLLAALVASVTVLKAVAAKLILIVGFFLWMIVKALWVKVDPPVGTVIERGQAPELFAMIDDLQRRLRAPRFHHVLITDDFNAGVVQSPRLGIFGWPRNYLLIGLPLLKALTAEQFKAVLAHEFGHLAKGHGRVSNWIYRQRLRWSRLLNVLEANESGGGFLFKPFLNWFAPYFNAYSFPMARTNEYAADATAVQLTSPQAAAQALTSVNVIDSYLTEQYWPGIHKEADEQPAPGSSPFLEMGRSVAATIDAHRAKAWLEQALARKTDSTDTHPALTDRLGAIGQNAILVLPVPGEAADKLLGRALPQVTNEFDRRWKVRIAGAWSERYQEVQEGRHRLAELDAKHDSGTELTLQETYDRALLTESMGGKPDEALTQLRALHARVPDDPTVCLTLGARLLGRDDAEGSALIERAMTLDEGTILQGYECLRDYHWRAGRTSEANDWHGRLLERSQLLEVAAKERRQVLLSDKFDPHELPDAALSELCVALGKVPGLRKAYFIRKRVRYLEHSPCYVLGFRVSKWYQLYSRKRTDDVLRGIQESVSFPGEALILSVEGSNWRFGLKFRRIKGARIL